MSKNFNDYVQKIASFVSTTNEELDAKLRVDNIDDLKTLPLDYYSNGALIICTENGLVYQYLESNPESTTLGKWREYGGGSSVSLPELVGTITDNTTSLPISRADGGKLQFLDYVWVSEGVTVPKTIGKVTINSCQDMLMYLGDKWWVVRPEITTVGVKVTDSTKESISGTATTQYQINIENKLADEATDLGTWD